MKRKIYTKRILKITALFLAVTVCTLILQEFFLCHSDNNRERIKGFYLEKKDTIDVVFVGASEVYCDYAPTYAYGEYGFTSYPLVSQGSTVKNYTTAVKEAVRTQHPKLIVIEINGALYEDRHFYRESYARNFIDSVPLNKNKIDYIEKYVTENKIEYYLPIIKFHNNWNKIPHGLKWDASILLDRARGYSLLKGVKNKTSRFDIDRESIYNYKKGEINKRRDLNENCKTELINLLEYCKNENLNVVFTRFPHAVTKEEVKRFRRANTAGDIIKEYGFDFVNFDFMLDEIGLVPNEDFYNTEHLNIFGQKKFTDFLSRYLMDNYGVEKSVLDEKTKAQWDRCAEYYNAYEKLNLEYIERNEEIHLGGDFRTYLEARKYIEK